MSSFASHVLVTGANRGIGLEWIRQLAPRTDRLYATCRHPDAATKLNALTQAHPDTVRIVPLDVADPESIAQAAALVADETDALDLLINNAGVDGGAGQDGFANTNMETLVNTFRINTAGPHLMTQAFADLLQAAPEATVVNITSQLGSIANTQGGTWQSYKISKAALNMATRLQAGSLGDSVTVVAMHPGWVQTDMGGPNARVTPQDAVAGMMEVIDALGPEDHGAFRTFDGGSLPW
mgnify:CR=1 FL=1